LGRGRDRVGSRRREGDERGRGSEHREEDSGHGLRDRVLTSARP
jgi:hypothetical protein